jgi:hypothetical protein
LFGGAGLLAFGKADVCTIDAAAHSAVCHAPHVKVSVHAIQAPRMSALCDTTELRLVLGLPWYGYDYQCLDPSSPMSGDLLAPASQRSSRLPIQRTDAGQARHMAEEGDVCELQAVPFAGAPCSDAAGVQRSYAEIMQSELICL